MSDDPTYLAELERTLEGLRKAGVPEELPPPAASPRSSLSTSAATPA
jgi:hypothetical protein